MLNKNKKILVYLILSFIIIFSIKVKVFALEEKSTIYFLGDSRFVGMKQYCEIENYKYYAEVGKGLSYLKQYMYEIKNKVSKNDFIIINFGVNDLNNKEEYVKFINQIEKEIPAKIIYMTVNPVEENSNYNVTNEKINEFNNYIVCNTNNDIYIMDTNKYLVKKGFTTNDGLHFTGETYKDILEYIETYLEYFDKE